MIRSAPLVVLGVLLAGYWGRVLRMAWKARRRTGRAANIVPSERAGRWARLLWAPTVGAWVACPFVVAFARPLPTALQPMCFSPAVAWVAAGVVGAGVWMSRICWRAMGKHWRMGIDPAERNPLIADGPFACVRHPIYALSGMMMLASVAAAPSVVMLLAGAVHLSLLAWESKREERHMRAIHGERYVEYQGRVGRFVPSLPVFRNGYN